MSNKKNPGVNQEQKKESWNDNLRYTGKILYSKNLSNHLQDKINAIRYKLVCYGSTEQSIKDKDGEPLIGVTYVLDKLESIEKMAIEIEQVLADKKPIFIDEREVFDYWKEHRLFDESQEE